MTTSETKEKFILLIEDDEFMANLLAHKLEQSNYKILRAADAANAREILAKNSINLILLDIILPGMDGLSFLQELKKDTRYSSVPVIITSNLGQQEQIDEGLSFGAADYIVKAHSTPTEIVNKVMSILSNA